MLATFAEYYSNNLATEIMKGLRRKHEQGGTPHKPPIGYLSKRELIGAQDIRSVIVDEERAPFVKIAFSLYGTGDWTVRRLATYLNLNPPIGWLGGVNRASRSPRWWWGVGLELFGAVLGVLDALAGASVGFDGSGSGALAGGGLAMVGR
jgi:hypothetical protein